MKKNILEELELNFIIDATDEELINLINSTTLETKEILKKEWKILKIANEKKSTMISRLAYLWNVPNRYADLLIKSFENQYRLKVFENTFNKTTSEDKEFLKNRWRTLKKDSSNMHTIVKIISELWGGVPIWCAELLIEKFENEVSESMITNTEINKQYQENKMKKFNNNIKDTNPFLGIRVQITK